MIAKSELNNHYRISNLRIIICQIMGPESNNAEIQTNLFFDS